jgi:hypothetical protein
MKKKLIVNALSALLALSLLTASSFALFTSTSAVNGNSIVNGTLTLSVLDPNGIPVKAFGADPAKTTTIYAGRTGNDAYRFQKDMLPNNELNFAAGDSASRSFVLSNVGTLDQYYRFYITNVQLTLKSGTVITDLSNTAFANYSVAIYGTNTHCGWFDPNAAMDPTSDKNITRITSFNSISSEKNAVGGVLYAVNGTVATGSSSEYKMLVTLKSGADQSLQGGKITFDIKYQAVQVANNYDPAKLGYQGFGGSLINMTTTEQALINWN